MPTHRAPSRSGVRRRPRATTQATAPAGRHRARTRSGSWPKLAVAAGLTGSSLAIAATVSTAGAAGDQPVEASLARPAAVSAVVAASSSEAAERSARSERISRTAEREPLQRNAQRGRQPSTGSAQGRHQRAAEPRPGKDRREAQQSSRADKAQQERKAERRAAKAAARHWVLPVQHYSLSARFGEVGSLWASVHTGLDFVGAYGAPVVSVAPGVVTSADYAGDYGYRVVVRLADGKRLWFCHLDSFTVHVGDRISAGEQVGTVGVTGNTTGPHLHLEVRIGGEPVDPYAALARHGLNP